MCINQVTLINFSAPTHSVSRLALTFGKSRSAAVTRIRTGVAAATTQSTNHYTITAGHRSTAEDGDRHGHVSVDASRLHEQSFGVSR